jgi:hypothetical protein
MYMYNFILVNQPHMCSQSSLCLLFPVTVFFSEANIVANLDGVDGSSLTVVRMEDAPLSGLFELSKKLFEIVKFPEGTPFVSGSASYLSCMGTDIYAGYRLLVV